MGRRAMYNKSTELEPKASMFEGDLFEGSVPTQEEAPPKKFDPQESRKSFKDTDLIPCVSITVGKLVMPGSKSKEVYRWGDIGSVQEVEYRDLIDEVRQNSVYVFEPRFIIQDEDFLSQHKDIEDKYGELYTPADIEQILQLSPTMIKAQLEKMPVGAQNALRDLAIRKINDGTLDSVQRVRALDEFFDTEMILKLTQ